MTEVVGVRFKATGKVYYFDPGGLTLPAGTDVIVETARGLEYGECSMGNTQVEDDSVIQPLRKVIRAATEEDRQTLLDNAQREKEALVICQQKVEKHRLEMKFIDAEITFDGSKMLFYFTADGRVDFRELVRDLASVFRTRIELRQIGVRDEAKLLGGLGICGKPFCCATFLEDFQPVSIKMAKEQSLSLNPTKISGTCGRLMCCLKFEQDAYEDLHRTTPTPGTRVATIDGPGVVIEIGNLLRGSLKVRLDASPENPKIYQKCEVGLPGTEQELRKAVKEEEPVFGAAYAGSPLGSLSPSPELEDSGDAAPGHLGHSGGHREEQRSRSRRGGRNARSSGDSQNRQHAKERAAQPAELPAEPESGAPVKPESESAGQNRSHSRRHRGGRGRNKRADAQGASGSREHTPQTERKQDAPNKSGEHSAGEKQNREHRRRSHSYRGKRQKNGPEAGTDTPGGLPGGGYSSGYRID